MVGGWKDLAEPACGKIVGLSGSRRQVRWIWLCRVANPSNRAENLENNIRPTSENLVFLDTVLLCQCPLGHGRHIVAVSIITIIRVLSTHHVSLLRALVSQQIFVPYPWASSISNKMVSQSWENDSARTNKKRSAANGMHKGDYACLFNCAVLAFVPFFPHLPRWGPASVFHWVLRLCLILFASDSRRSPRPCGHTRARDLSQARRQFLGSHGTAETCVSRVPDHGGHARVRAHAR